MHLTAAGLAVHLTAGAGVLYSFYMRKLRGETSRVIVRNNTSIVSNCFAEVHTAVSTTPKWNGGEGGVECEDNRYEVRGDGEGGLEQSDYRLWARKHQMIGGGNVIKI